jgi:hypothetical protein
LLFRILKAFTAKIVSLDKCFPVMCKYYHKKASTGLGADTEDLTKIPEYKGFLDLGFCQPIKTAQNHLDSNEGLFKGILVYFDG